MNWHNEAAERPKRRSHAVPTHCAGAPNEETSHSWPLQYTTHNGAAERPKRRSHAERGYE